MCCHPCLSNFQCFQSCVSWTPFCNFTFCYVSHDVVSGTYLWVAQWHITHDYKRLTRHAWKRLERGAEWLIDKQGLSLCSPSHQMSRLTEVQKVGRCIDITRSIYWSAILVSLKSEMQGARIFASSHVEELRNHSVTFLVSKTDFTCRLR